MMNLLVSISVYFGHYSDIYRLVANLFRELVDSHDRSWGSEKSIPTTDLLLKFECLEKNHCIDQMVTNIYFSEMYVNVFFIPKIIGTNRISFPCIFRKIVSIFRDSGKYWYYPSVYHWLWICYKKNQYLWKISTKICKYLHWQIWSGLHPSN